MPPSASANGPAILLVDNGSLEAAAVRSLREIAARLSLALGRPVTPLSLLHSSTIPAEQLDGIPAEILEPALGRRLREGLDHFLVVPLFFGPSAALTDYLPKRLGLLKASHPQLQVRLAPPVVDLAAPDDPRLTAILEDRVRRALPADGIPPAVILVDHGSPQPAVTRVRDALAVQLRGRLAGAVRHVLAASMERRPEPAYAFNEPLLDRAFDQPGFETGSVIVVPLFFSPGRHAGPDGDIVRICAAARQRHPQLQTLVTGLVGSHPGLIPILVDRVRGGLAASPL